MQQNYGLGRGLASLIPKKSNINPSDGADSSSQKVSPQVVPGVSANAQTMTPGPKAAIPTIAEALGRTEASTKNITELEISRILPNPHQPRIQFDEEKLVELGSSIKEHGIIQPLVVTKKDGQFELIAGERRLQAAKMVGLQKVPVVVREASDQQKLEIAVTENVQRHDLNPIEEAKSYLKMAQDFDMNQEEIAKKVGRSRSVIANKERLLKLPIEIQKALIENRISEGHAKAILAVTDPEKQRAFFELILKNNLTVRQTEEKIKEVSVKTHKRTLSVDPEIKAAEDRLTGALGTKVKISKSGNGGRIIIDYYSAEELSGILDKIGAQ